MSDDLPSTPEGRLIRRARERAIPKLTIRAAAAKIGMSAEQWGYAERGYIPSRGGSPPREFHPPAATLARMASAMSVTPGELESPGERPDAAEILREILRTGRRRLRSPPRRGASPRFPLRSRSPMTRPMMRLSCSSCPRQTCNCAWTCCAYGG